MNVQLNAASFGGRRFSSVDPRGQPAHSLHFALPVGRWLRCMEDAPPAAVLINFGDLPSLVSLALQPEPARVVLWHPAGCPEAAGRAACVRLQGESFNTRAPIFSHIGGAAAAMAGVAEDDLPVHLRDAQLLLRGCALAERLGATRLLWPVQAVDPELPEVVVVPQLSALIERAGLVAMIANGGEGGGRIAIDLPVVDLTDEQLVDLADDRGAPLEAFWPCLDEGAEPCGRCSGCGRWRAAMERFGAEWPWRAVTAGA